MANISQILVRGGLLIDGTGAPPVERGAVLVDGARILAVGKEEEIAPRFEGEVVDCEDQVLIPGLIDCHNHLSMDPTLDDYLHRMDDSEAALTLRACTNMAADLHAGVTTARCLGDRNFLDIECRRAVESGRMEGPRLLVAAKGIRASHGHGFVGYPFDGLDAIRCAVRGNLRGGADLIKFYVTGTLKGARGIPSYFSEQEIGLVVEEAHRVGVRTAVHCIGGIGLEWCLEAGVDSIEHGYFATDRQIGLLAASDSWLVLTPSPFLTEARIRTLPPDLIADHLHQRDEAAERMAAALKGGVRIAVGTDGMHAGLAQEIEYLVQLGASEEDALAAATRNAAEVCGLTEHVGTLESGKFADIVGIHGNPLEEIEALNRVKTVIAGGRVCRKE